MRPLARILAAAAAVVAFAGAGNAQETALKVDSLASRYRVDFAVPESPAFSLIKTEESQILRPSVVREVAAAASNFSGSEGGFALPKSFGLEVAPFLLANGARLTLNEYRNKHVLYTSRVSVATGRDTARRAGLALALRINPINRADPRLNRKFIAALNDSLAAITQVYAAALMKGPPPNGSLPKLNAADSTRVERLRSSIDTLHAVFERSTWNAHAWDIAAGVRATGRDSLGNDLEVGEGSLWSTYSIPMKKWGQLLVGGKASAVREYSDEWAGEFRGGVRGYAGVNRYKGFLEAEALGRSAAAPRWLLNGGVEARFTDSVWSTFSAGLNWEGSGGANLSSRFTLSLAAPQVGKK